MYHCVAISAAVVVEVGAALVLLDDARIENVMQAPGVSSCGAWFLEGQATLNLNHVRPKPTGPPWRCKSSESQDRVGPPWGLFHGFLNNTKNQEILGTKHTHSATRAKADDFFGVPGRDWVSF